ncbi:MAG: ABC-2 transporter permease [Peptococcaceae bacterium]|jgi:hypothetical protein|nr:ABC-2 transporter permease [Peptococcaceae bacterium]
MAKMTSFIRLDLITVKPYFTVKNLSIYAVVALFLTATSGNISSGIGVGMMLSGMFTGYPFALGEKSNLDALYATLALNRQTVVLGRYLFTLALNLVAIIFSVALSSAGLLAAGILGSSIGSEGVMWSFLALAAIIIVIQAIQLPLYFKLGYSKAKFMSLMPFLFIMAFVAALMALSENGKFTGVIADFIAIIMFNSNGLALFTVLALCLIVFLSYRLSLAFYQKREF